MKKIFHYNKSLSKRHLVFCNKSIINIDDREDIMVIKTKGDIDNILVSLVNAMAHIIYENGHINSVQETIKRIEGHYLDNK